LASGNAYVGCLVGEISSGGLTNKELGSMFRCFVWFCDVVDVPYGGLTCVINAFMEASAMALGSIKLTRFIWSDKYW
jgi:hypothetical protein